MLGWFKAWRLRRLQKKREVLKLDIEFWRQKLLSAAEEGKRLAQSLTMEERLKQFTLPGRLELDRSLREVRQVRARFEGLLARDHELRKQIAWLN